MSGIEGPNTEVKEEHIDAFIQLTLLLGGRLLRNLNFFLSLYNWSHRFFDSLCKDIPVERDQTSPFFSKKLLVLLVDPKQDLNQ